MQPVFLVDVDDTLVDSHRFKADFFTKYAQALGFTTHKEKEQAWELYRLYRQKTNEPIGMRGFGKWLKIYFSYEDNVKAINEVIDNICFENYLLPEAKVLIEKLKALGKVVLWTSGNFEEQQQKVTDTGLNLILRGAEVVCATTEGWQEKVLKEADSILIDPQKTKITADRLRQFRVIFPENLLVYIDNSPSQIAKAMKVNDPELTTVWVNTGDMEVDRESRETLLKGSQHGYSGLAELIGDSPFWKMVEDGINPGSREKQRKPSHRERG